MRIRLVEVVFDHPHTVVGAEDRSSDLRAEDAYAVEEAAVVAAGVVVAGQSGCK